MYLGVCLGVFYVVDLDTADGKCSAVRLKTLQEFGKGSNITLRKSVLVNKKGTTARGPTQPRVPFKRTLNMIHSFIRTRYKYTVLKQNCDTAVNLWCYGDDNNNQTNLVRVSTHQVRRTPLTLSRIQEISNKNKKPILDSMGRPDFEKSSK